MPSPKKDHIKNTQQQLSIYDDKSQTSRKTLEGLHMKGIFSHHFKEEAPEKVATFGLTTPSKTSSVEQGYLTSPESIMTADSSALPKKRAAEDELSSSPIKKVIVGNFKDHVRNELLQNQMASKINLNEANKQPCSAGTFEHLRDVDPLRPFNCKIDSNRLWDVDSLNLGQYPRLVTTKLTYRYQQLRNPGTHAWEYVCFPIAPADDIKKSLHLGGKMKQFRWTGLWAERKLRKEIAKYEAIKEFWLFNYSAAAEELLSPWVRIWLREFLGDEIMDVMEAAMEKMAEGRWGKASENMLFQKGNWESLYLRFKPRETLL